MADSGQGPPGPKSNARGRKKGEGLSFEDSLNKLEAIVRRLEEEQVPLEESLRLFADGKNLARACELELQNAEIKVRQLIEESGGIGDVPFETGQTIPAKEGDEDESADPGRPSSR